MTPEGEVDSTDGLLVHYTHSEFASRWAYKYKDLFRYVEDDDQYRHFNGRYWKKVGPDAPTHFIEKYNVALLDQIKGELPLNEGDPSIYIIANSNETKDVERAEKWSIAQCRAMCNAGNIASILRLARTKRPIAVAGKRFDQDPDLLNMPNGTYDRRTREKREHSAADMITHTTRACYDPTATGPTFDRFFDRVQTEKRQQLILSALRYSIRGTGGEVAFIHVGSGGNGKSTLFDAVEYALGTYAHTADARILTQAGEDDHPTALAELEGMRVSVIKLGSKRVGADQLRAIVAENSFNAHKMHKDSRTIQATHTFHVLQNEAPPPNQLDPSAKRRYVVIDWDVILPDSERDGSLGESLKLEADYILTKILDAPELDLTTLDRSETEKYLGRNTVYAWFAKYMELDPTARIPAAELYDHYKELYGDEAVGQKSFGQQLSQYGVGRANENYRKDDGKNAFHTVRTGYKFK